MDRIDLLDPDDADGGGELRRGIFRPELPVGILLAFWGCGASIEKSGFAGEGR